MLCDTVPFSAEIAVKYTVQFTDQPLDDLVLSLLHLTSGWSAHLLQGLAIFMQFMMWTFVVLVLAGIVSSLPTNERHTASNGNLHHHESSSTHRHAAPQKGLGIDLNMPPPLDLVQSSANNDASPGSGGSFSHDLPRRDGQVGVGLSIRPASLLQKDKSIHQSSSDESNDNGKRMRTLDSLMQRGSHAHIPAIRGRDATSSKKLRIMPAHHAKGKVLWYSGDSSTSSEDTFPASSTDPLSPHKLFEKNSAISSGFNTQSSNAIHPDINKKEGHREGFVSESERHQHEPAKESFYQEWNQHDIYPNLDPRVMAEKVFQTKVPDDMSKDTFGRFASQEIREQSGNDYLAHYNSYLKNLKASYYRHDKKAEQTGELNGLDEEVRRKILMQRALGRQAYGPKVAYSRKKPGKDAADQKRWNQIEQAARKHLAAKNINFDQDPLNTVEIGLRDMIHTDYGLALRGRGSFVNDLHKILRKKKGAVDEDIERFITARTADRNFAYKGLRLH